MFGKTSRRWARHRMAEAMAMWRIEERVGSNPRQVTWGWFELAPHRSEPNLSAPVRAAARTGAKGGSMATCPVCLTRSLTTPSASFASSLMDSLLHGLLAVLAVGQQELWNRQT